MKEFPLNVQLIRLIFTLVGVFLLIFIIPENTFSKSVDTLGLQLQWAYPLAVKDMKLVDFDHDGISEILVGFNSDSSRVGILDAVSQNMVWQSPGFDGSIHTVAAGDRNNDGWLDIVCGGQRSDSAIGYIEIFDGPDFNSVHTLSGFDQKVLSAAISARSLDSLPQIFLGTYLYRDGCSQQFPYPCFKERNGKLYVLDGQNLIPEYVTTYGAVREILLSDINSDGYEELILGMDHLYAYGSAYPSDITGTNCRIHSNYCGNMYIYYEAVQGVGGLDASFDALILGNFYGRGSSVSIIGSGHICRAHGGCSFKLTSWNASSAKLEWSIEWDTGSYITDLDLCSIPGGQPNAICAAYLNGLIEFRFGSDGSFLVVYPQSHSIYQLELGNVDHDNLVEICVTSRDSLYVYEAEFMTTDVEEIEDYSHPKNFCLFQNYPNPFNPETNIRFAASVTSNVTVAIYNILGEEIRTFKKRCEPGTHRIMWDGKNSSGEDVASGVYLYRLSAGNYQETKKMALIR